MEKWRFCPAQNRQFPTFFSAWFNAGWQPGLTNQSAGEGNTGPSLALRVSEVTRAREQSVWPMPAFIVRFALAGWWVIVDCLRKLAERTHCRTAEKWVSLSYCVLPNGAVCRRPGYHDN